MTEREVGVSVYRVSACASAITYEMPSGMLPTDCLSFSVYGTMLSSYP